MAAIKGTTKQVELRKDEQIQFDVIKTDKNLHNSNISLNSSVSEQYQRTQVVNPISMSPKHNQLLQSSNASSSSMHSMNESIHSSNSTTTSRNNQSHSNSSESVIYRPGASDSGSDFYHSSAASNATAVSSAASSNGHMPRFNTIPNKINGNVATTIYENHQQQQQQQQHQQQGSPAVPLRSIMRGYNNHVTLPTRGARAGSAGQLYYEEGSQGYCSDGDALRKQAAAIRYTDIENGYLSEGGVTNPHFMSIFRNRPQLPTTIEERLVARI